MFDNTVYRLGKLCKKKHEHEGTGKSLRYIKGGNCIECLYDRSQTEEHKDYHKQYSHIPEVKKKKREYTAIPEVKASKKKYDKVYVKLESRKEKRESNRLHQRYGITVEDKKRMYAEQNGCCAICETHFEKLAIDHNHTTGKVRGLLCGSCNRAIGLLKDNIYVLEKAIKYLKEN